MSLRHELASPPSLAAASCAPPVEPLGCAAGSVDLEPMPAVGMLALPQFEDVWQRVGMPARGAGRDAGDLGCGHSVSAFGFGGGVMIHRALQVGQVKTLNPSTSTPFVSQYGQ